MYPTRIWGHLSGETKLSDNSSCYYCFSLTNTLSVYRQDGQGRWDLLPGMYLASSEPIVIAGNGACFITERLGYRGLFTLGGPTEKTGRLTYIDSCTSTLLIQPARQGDPCLNLLHFPKNITQQMHIHPTIRVGCVSEGCGFSVDEKGTEQPLKKGDVFFIDQNKRHFFKTTDESMSVIAYHPDSDWGPTDQEHPMLNRTYLR